MPSMYWEKDPSWGNADETFRADINLLQPVDAAVSSRYVTGYVRLVKGGWAAHARTNTRQILETVGIYPTLRQAMRTVKTFVTFNNQGE